MPFSQDNPNRNRNFAIAVVAVVIVFSVIMGGYLWIDDRGGDTGAYERFLTLLVTVVLLGVLNAWKSFKAADISARTDLKVDRVVHQTNGDLEERIGRVVEARLRAIGQPPQEGLEMGSDSQVEDRRVQRLDEDRPPA